MARTETDDADDLLSALRFGVDSYAASVADDGCVDDLEQMLAEGAFDEAAHLAHACAVRQAEFERTDWVATGWRELGDPTLPELVKTYIATIGMEKMIELQQYIKKPPGKGMGVVYVQISPTNKMYVGQHCHGKEGASFVRTRMNKAGKRDRGCRHVHNAFNKYGLKNFTHIILQHGPEGVRNGDLVDGDCNEREIYFIDYWDLLRPEIGMNLRTGGGGGKFSLETRARMRAFQAQPHVRAAKTKRMLEYWEQTGVREAHRECAVAQAAREAVENPGERSRRAAEAEAARVAAGGQSLAERAAAWRAENPEEWSRIQSEAQSRPEVREAKRQRGIAQWADADEETRAAWVAANSAAQLRPEVRDAARERAIAQAEREAAENPGERSRRAAAAEAARVAAGGLSLPQKLAAWRTDNREKFSRIQSEAHSRPEVREAARERAIAQFAREEAENPGGRSRRTIEWQANNPEKVAAARAKARATTMRKRQKRLDDAPDDAARAKLQKQFDKEDRSTERKRQKKTTRDAGSSATHAASA